MILHDPNQKHGDDTYKGPFVITKVYDNAQNDLLGSIMDSLGSLCIRTTGNTADPSPLSTGGGTLFGAANTTVSARIGVHQATKQRALGADNRGSKRRCVICGLDTRKEFCL